ncbi:hypothetical protein IJ670_07645 [bacterium]|nr:hypothetical protein [bacterium]
MSEKELNSIGFSVVSNTMNNLGIKITEEQLASAFEECAKNSGEVSVSDFTQSLVEKYNIPNDFIKILDDTTQEVTSEITSVQALEYSIEKLASKDEKDNLSFDDIEISANEYFINLLDNFVAGYEKSFIETKENSGIIAQGWDFCKNLFGAKKGSDNIQKTINSYKTLVENLKKNPANIDEVYLKITGNTLDEKEIDALLNWKDVESCPFKNQSEFTKEIENYQKSQKGAVDILATVSCSLAAVGCIVAAPFTGGVSLAGIPLATAALATGVGAATYIGVQGIDGLTEKDGWNSAEIKEDILKGLINGVASSGGMVAGNVALNGLANTALSSSAVKLISQETVALSLSETMAGGNYLIDVALNDEMNFSWNDFSKTMITSATGALVAGGISYGISSSGLNSVMSSSAPSRYLYSGIMGTTSGFGAGFSASGVNYLLEGGTNTQEWLSSSIEGGLDGALIGFGAGVGFEAVNSFGINARLNQKNIQKFDVNKLDFDYKNADEVLNAIQNGKISSNELLEIYKSVSESEARALNRALIRATHPDSAKNPDLVQYAQTINLAHQAYKNLTADNVSLVSSSENVSYEQTANNSLMILSQDEILSQLNVYSLNGNVKASEILQNASKIQNSPEKTTYLKNALDILQKGETYKILEDYAKELSLEINSNQNTIDILWSTAEALDLSFYELDLNTDGSQSLITDMGRFDARAKSEKSILSKLINRAYELESDIPSNLNEVKKIVKDAQASRLILENADWHELDIDFNAINEKLGNIISESDYGLLVQYLENPSTLSLTPSQENAFNLMRHEIAMQTIDVQSKVIEERIANLVKEGKLQLVRIDNYTGENGIPYLSQDSMNQMQKTYQEWYDNELQKIESGNSKYTKEKFGTSEYIYDPKTDRKYYRSTITNENKLKTNGYTAAQFTFVDEQGRAFELQLKGKASKVAGEHQHKAYDGVQGKLTAQASINEVVKKIEENATTKAEYDKYCQEVFNNCRLKELGFGIKEVDISNYPTLNSMLKDENIRNAITINVEKLYNDYYGA